MFDRLRDRLLLTYALIIGVLLGVLGVALLVYLAQNPAALQRMRLATNFLAGRTDLTSRVVSRGRLQDSVRSADEAFGVRVVLVEPDGRVLLDSRADRAPPLELPPDISSDPRAGRLRDESGQTWVYRSRPLANERLLVVAVPTQRPLLSLIDTIRETLLAPFVYAGVLALILAILLSFFMSQWIAAPLQRIAESARNLRAGAPVPAPPEGPQEVRALGRALNEMIAQVRTSQQSQLDFVANVSHELKTPLTSIQGFAQALMDGTAHTPEARLQAAEVIYQESARMNRLVLDLLALARLDAGTADLQREPLDLNVLLSHLAERFQPQARDAGVELALDLRPIPDVIGDEDRLAQVFTNLLDNAVKYTPSGGRVLLTLRQADHQAHVTVEDTGPGIPTEELSRVFERFYQLDKSRPGGPGKGTGLGLAIAREIVEAHQGAITVRSQPGQGAVFVVKLPFVRPDDTTVVARRDQKNVA